MYVGPLYHCADIPPPAGFEDPLVKATMNPGMDAPFLDVMGPVSHLHVHLAHHGSSHVRLSGNFDDLNFLESSAELLWRLDVGSAQVADVSALAALTNLRTLVAPPREADALLPALPDLRTLYLYGPHGFDMLSRCVALRELLLIDREAVDLLALPTLDRLELLGVYTTSPRGLADITRFRSLRTLLFSRKHLPDADTTRLLEEQFGVGIADVMRRPVAASAGHVRLDADEGKSISAAINSTSAVAYSAEVTSSRPGCVMLLIDRSASTEQQFGIDLRVTADPNARPQQVATRHGILGPDGEMLIAEGIASAVNAFLRQLIARCTVNGEIAREMHIGIIEYGARVGSAWGGPLTGRTLVPIAEVAQHPLSDSAGGPVWITPSWSGETPLGDAFEYAHEIVADWARVHPDSLPPVTINLTSGETTGGDVGRHGWALRSVHTDHGNGLLFTIQREYGWGMPRFGVTGNNQTERDQLFRLSSVMPPCIEQAARMAGYPLLESPRGYFKDATAADFENLLNVFTALPGLPWSTDMIRHPIAPQTPSDWQITQDAWPVEPRIRTPALWKAPKLRGPMTEELFWSVIDKSARGCDDLDERADRITRMLAQLSEDDILEFDRLLEERLTAAYRWDLWAVAFVAMNGCSDDGFDYFCAWLVAQGRTYFEASLAKPEHAARRIAPGDEAEFESLLSCADTAYERSSGKTDWLDRVGRSSRGDPKGEPWEESDLSRLFPKLVKKYA